MILRDYTALGAALLLLASCNKGDAKPQPSPEPSGNVITTAAQFQSFIQEKAAQCSGGETYTLGNDIDMTDVEISRCASSFNGTLDGAGYTLSNLEATCPLFACIESEAQVLSLNLDSSCSFLISNDEYSEAGCFAGQNCGNIDDCTNEASLVISGSAAGINGGFAGIVAGGDISGCTQNGSLQYVGSNANSVLGGIFGSVPEIMNDVSLTNTAADCSLDAGVIPWKRAGMVIGHFPNQDSDCTVGNDAFPVQVAGTFKTADREANVTARSHQSYLCGYDNIDALGNQVIAKYCGEEIPVSGK